VFEYHQRLDGAPPTVFGFKEIFLDLHQRVVGQAPLVDIGAQPFAGAEHATDSLAHLFDALYPHLGTFVGDFVHGEFVVQALHRAFQVHDVEVSLDDILSQRFGDYLNSIPLPAMLTVFKAEEWDNYGLMTVDSSMIYSIVDVLLGGRRGTAAMRVEGRPYTTIERTLVERMIHVVLADLSAAFDLLSPVTFRFDRLETNPRFATISQPSNAAIVARLRIDMEDRGGRLEILIPFATLEPVRELLLQMFMGEKFGRDSIWETHLAEEMWFTEVGLEAVLDTQWMSLKKVLDLKVGSRMMLNTDPESAIELRCGDVPMFQGRMGRRGNNIAIRVDHKKKKKTSEDA